jgi:hypothetical protein
MFLWCPFHLDAPFGGYQAIIHCFVLKSVVTTDNLNVGIGNLNALLMCSYVSIDFDVSDAGWYDFLYIVFCLSVPH